MVPLSLLYTIVHSFETKAMGTLLPVTYVARFSCGLFLSDFSDDKLLRMLQNTTLVLDDKFLLYDEFFSSTPTYCLFLLV